MAMQYKSGFCKRCNDQRKVERAGTNNILYLLLAIVWLIIWGLGALNIGGWRCSTCGSKKVSKVR